MVPSTTAAGTISHTARGLASLRTKSASDAAPMALSLASSVTACGDSVEDHTFVATADQRRTMFAPIRPNPIIPSCMRVSCSRRSVRARPVDARA